MFRHKKHLFFDLDHTLWDFEANAQECMDEIFDVHHLKKFGFTFSDFMTSFTVLNQQLWKDLEQKRITHEYIRQRRFQGALGKLNVKISQAKSEEMNALFLRLLPQKRQLISGALEILEVLKPKYQLHILSNGYQAIQNKKLAHSGLASYFDKVITNDMANASKPDKLIFDFALKEANATLGESLMIGDNYEADILGAKNAGFDTVHYCTKGLSYENGGTLKINRLEKILTYL